MTLWKPKYPPRCEKLVSSQSRSPGGAVSPSTSSVMQSLIGRCRFFASTLVGTIGVLIPAIAAHAEASLPSSVGAETTSSSVSTATSPATPGGSLVIAAAARAQPSGDTSIRPFKFHASDEALADLRRRVAATRWPSPELVTDASQGVQFATIQKLARYH